jgi:hypothetical protein
MMNKNRKFTPEEAVMLIPPVRLATFMKYAEKAGIKGRDHRFTIKEIGEICTTFPPQLAHRVLPLDERVKQITAARKEYGKLS